ncbi:pantoate--beta-alanine ligase [Virgibacillus sp. NKC19-3]|uniref:pantoate--beta-alanine ligase n=1 Tax=Virgibacillus saliphilus TaxID=2831674 RepID=UPI001C9AB2F5|nr:pantoate--beta-alanine ligase [Virgibacillus sp. NKC19-3]MBY7143512.1 pantoate--beta-alanine ligase [Virgibacillus sp. NKC19-3]
MEIIRSVEKVKNQCSDLIKQDKQIGFVATMGFFHEGHLNLMTQAKKENDIVVASIFVNPLQFGPNEDYENYPRDEEHDILLAKQTGVDILFIPTVREMYPNQMLIRMSVEARTDVLCGRSRPGHFDGVITVLTKLFHIIQPNRTYFGLKDAQQVAVVDALIISLNFPIELIGIETIREQDGLAKSSRNVHLNNEERNEAVWIYKALMKGQQLVVDGEKNPAIVVNEVKNVLREHTSGTIDYVELVSYPRLTPIIAINEQVILATAVKFRKARLIDNLLLNENGEIVNQYLQEGI